MIQIKGSEQEAGLFPPVSFYSTQKHANTNSFNPHRDDPGDTEMEKVTSDLLSGARTLIDLDSQ